MSTQASQTVHTNTHARTRTHAHARTPLLAVLCAGLNFSRPGSHRAPKRVRAALVTTVKVKRKQKLVDLFQKAETALCIFETLARVYSLSGSTVASFK